MFTGAFAQACDIEEVTLTGCVNEAITIVGNHHLDIVLATIVGDDPGGAMLRCALDLDQVFADELIGSLLLATLKAQSLNW